MITTKEDILMNTLFDDLCEKYDRKMLIFVLCMNTLARVKHKLENNREATGMLAFSNSCNFLTTIIQEQTGWTTEILIEADIALTVLEATVEKQLAGVPH